MAPDTPLPGWPRGLAEPWAAAYVGLSASSFRRQVDAGEAPKPIHLTRGRQVWLREELDSWLDRKANRAPAGSSLDGREWMEA